MKNVLGELQGFSEKLAVPPDVRDEAVRICNRALEGRLGSRMSLIRVALASIYAACRESDFPRTLDDVAAVSGLRKKDLARCYRLLVNELDLKIPVADPAEYVARVASRAKASAEVQKAALEILWRAERAGITAGKEPMVLAASALYMASALEGEKFTQRRAAEVSGVREPTIRNEYRRLRKVL